MNKLRIEEKNKVILEFKSLKKVVERNKATVDRFKSQDKTAFNLAQIEKLSEKIKKDEETLLSFEEKIKNIESGSYDSVIEEEIEKNLKKNQKHNDNTTRKIKEKNEKKTEEKEKLDTFYKNQKHGGEISKYSLEKETDKYKTNLVNLPDYITENLKEMPSNKGYIWKGIWCFGELKSKNQYPLILFEKIRGGNLHIHEISEKYHSIFEKVGKNNKNLISKTEKICF
jgi:glucan-binding YG repeat protein